MRYSYFVFTLLSLLHITNIPYSILSALGMVTAMDEAIGHVRQSLERKGILNNTLIVFISDVSMICFRFG